jgi:hypothetical protein
MGHKHGQHLFVEGQISLTDGDDLFCDFDREKEDVLVRKVGFLGLTLVKDHKDHLIEELVKDVAGD